MSKELAKRLIEEAVEQYTSEHEGLFDAKSKKKLSKDLYCKFLADLISLEDIKGELNEIQQRTT
jgi:hypothetical protein